MKLPIEFVEEMSKIFKEDLDKFLESLDCDNVKSMTIDLNKLPIEVVEEELKQNNLQIDKIPYIPNGYYYKGKVGDTILHHAGIIYSQDCSAALPVEALGINKGDIVLDVCSAPGGKTIQILEKLKGTGLLVSNEVVYNRAKILYENIVRFGYSNTIITNNSPKDFDKNKLLFDKILVDAPCSGEGMFRKKDIDTHYWNLKNVEACKIRQLEILESVKDLLKVGGTLVYSTCTYNLEENEKVVAEFVSKNPEYEIVDLPKAVFDNTSRGQDINNIKTAKTGKRFPHIHKGEGQFIACLKKVKGKNRDIDYFLLDKYRLLGKKEQSNIVNNIRNFVDISDYNIYSKGENLYIYNPVAKIDLTGLNVVNLGVYMGSYSKGEIKLSHDFYKAVGTKFINKLELTKTQVETYLTGNEIEVDTNIKGIVAITYKGIAIGGGKIVGGRLKNYYPKNLRNK